MVARLRAAWLIVRAWAWMLARRGLLSMSEESQLWPPIWSSSPAVADGVRQGDEIEGLAGLVQFQHVGVNEPMGA